MVRATRPATHLPLAPARRRPRPRNLSGQYPRHPQVTPSSSPALLPRREARSGSAAAEAHSSRGHLGKKNNSGDFDPSLVEPTHPPAVGCPLQWARRWPPLAQCRTRAFARMIHLVEKSFSCLNSRAESTACRLPRALRATGAHGRVEPSKHPDPRLAGVVQRASFGMVLWTRTRVHSEAKVK